MLKVEGYASIFNLKSNDKETCIFGTLRSADKVEGKKDKDGQQLYETTFIDCVLVGKACEEGLHILKEKMFIKINSSKLQQYTYQKDGKNVYAYKLVIFDFEEVQTKQDNKKKRSFA